MYNKKNLSIILECSRFTTLKYVRYDHIKQLPLPQKIKDYLLDTQYYSEYVVDLECDFDPEL